MSFEEKSLLVLEALLLVVGTLMCLTAETLRVIVFGGALVTSGVTALLANAIIETAIEKSRKE